MKIIVLVFIACLFASGSAFSQDFTSTDTKTVNVASGDDLEIYNINGDVHISEWDSDMIRLVYTITCPSQEMLDCISVECDTDGGLKCNVDYSDDMDDYDNSSVDFEVSLPAGVDLDLDIALVDGTLTLTGGSGSGQLELISGSMNVDGFQGKLEASLVNGAMTITDVPQLESAEIVSGTLDCSLDAVLNDMSIESVSGDIGIDLSAPAHVEVETLSGNISISDVFDAYIDEGYVGRSTEFGQGEHTVSIGTVSGDVKVTD